LTEQVSDGVADDLGFVLDHGDGDEVHPCGQ
jgi:hypothetical protein